MNASDLFEQGFTYQDFLQRYGTIDQQTRWKNLWNRIVLTTEQQALLNSFQRVMPVFVLAGAWCGDCADQCPIFERFAEASPNLRIRYFDRDQAPRPFAESVKICGGSRVPSVIFYSEDFTEVARYGEKTLAKYRDIAQRASGESCSTGLCVDSTMQGAVIKEWLEQFERAQLICRLSARLRQKHGD
jgi:thiol-disulfide isomerase/thioredoxin